MVKKIKCNICNHKFYIDKSAVKEVVENNGVTAAFNGVKIFNAIDCPNCGCQKVLWVRLQEKLKNKE